MALILNSSGNFIEVSLDGLTDFDCTTDLIGLGMLSNAPDGLRVRKIIFLPSDVGGTYDKLKDEYRDDSTCDKGKVCKPYIHANETVVSVVNQSYIIFEI